MDIKAVNRFVSALAGAFRSFYIYNQDNKAFDEILQNLSKRFQETQNPPEPLLLGITNRSLLHQGTAVGFPELTITLANSLRNLGYKAIRFQSPLQGRNIFQLMHVLTGKDSNESKIEKLMPLVDNGEEKSITLVAFTANSMLLRMSDDVIKKRLAPLGMSRAQGGNGFAEQFGALSFASVPDLTTWVASHLSSFDSATKSFVQNIIDAVLEGYFPGDRFLRVFPMPDRVRAPLAELIDMEVPAHVRRATALGHRFIPQKTKMAGRPRPIDWPTRISTFSAEEVKNRQELSALGGASPASKDLDLAEALLQETGANFTFGLTLLLRTLGEKNSVAVQEKSLRLASAIWKASATGEANPAAIGLLSALRQHLSSIQNITLALFPLRTATVESPQFTDGVRYFVSLGKYCLIPLLNALDAEQDRGMRKKLCLVLAAVAREDGVDLLMESLAKAPPFLKRNIIMILGDVRAAQALPAVIPLISDAQKIVRGEAVRFLCRINNDEAHRALLPVARGPSDPDLRQLAITLLSQTPKYKDQVKGLS